MPDHIKPKLRSQEIKKNGAICKEKILKLQKAEIADAKAATCRQRGFEIDAGKYYESASQTTTTHDDEWAFADDHARIKAIKTILVKVHWQSIKANKFMFELQNVVLHYYDSLKKDFEGKAAL